MILSQAKYILELNVKEAGNQMPPDTLSALRLGIEAQRFILDNRHKATRSVFDLLPGETPKPSPL